MSALLKAMLQAAPRVSEKAALSADCWDVSLAALKAAMTGTKSAACWVRTTDERLAAHWAVTMVVPTAQMLDKQQAAVLDAQRGFVTAVQWVLQKAVQTADQWGPSSWGKR